jgi:hypothetical protein
VHELAQNGDRFGGKVFGLVLMDQPFPGAGPLEVLPEIIRLQPVRDSVAMDAGFASGGSGGGTRGYQLQDLSGLWTVQSIKSYRRTVRRG